MTPIETIPFDTPIEAEVKQPSQLANNMAMVYANKYRKGLCTLEEVPESLRQAVSQLINKT